MSDEDKLILVENFIYNDKVQNILSEINDNVMDFNILEITGMGNQEIKHSNILGWLFDDSEHNLEYQVLDNFLKKVVQEKDNECDKLQEYIYLSKKKKDIAIYREKDYIDLLVVDEANKIVITIENKVNAKERTDGNGGGQLQTYEDIINNKYNNEYDKYFIFLTIDLEESSKDNWLKANHQMVADVIGDILKSKEINTKTKIILESYIDLLKRNGIVADKVLETLCKKIWENQEYANAMDILIENRRSKIKQIYELIKSKKFPNQIYDIELSNISRLYELIDKKWGDEQIFELQIVYYDRKDEYIWFGYYYPNLEEESQKFQTLCENIIGKRYTDATKLLKIDKKYIANKEIDTIVDDIIYRIEQEDQKIKILIDKYLNT